MADGPTIGVLSPFAGGPYFGGIIASIARSARKNGGRVIAIQTLDAGRETADTPGPPMFRHPVAWQRVSGFVVIINAVSDEYLARIKAAGKPVVVVGHEYPGFAYPTILSDNAAGIRQAVEHLIRHGHRAIAYLGYLGAHDLRERRDAYRRVMRDNGIDPDPRLCYEALDNNTVGEHAARQILEADVPFTAVVVGTDANAIELINILGMAGYSVPDRVAVVGFDDMEEARYSVPSLSSVRQPFDEIGIRAYELLGSQVRGEEVRAGVHCVPTAFIVRESCGCTGFTQPDAADTPLSTRDALGAAFTASFGLSRRPAATDALAAAVDVIAEAIEAAATGVAGPEPTRMHQALAGLDRYAPLASLDELMPLVRRYARTVAEQAGRADAAIEVERRVQDIILKIAQASARGQHGNSTYFQAALSTQYVVSMDLLRCHEKNPRGLEWLARTHARGGCLGQWHTGGGQPDTVRPCRPTPLAQPTPLSQPGCPATGEATDAAADADGEAALEIVGDYLRGRQQTDPLTATTTAVSAFPPEEIISLTDSTEDEMVFVIPVKSDASDWGLLAVVSTIESAVPTGRETINQWGALLNVALDHEAVLESLRQQEDRLRRAALYDELTGLPNRMLFIERLRQAMRRMRRRSDYQFAVLFLDIDGFKIINDSLGHSAGDRLLIQVADRIRTVLREVDTAARFGGDEFLILLEDVASVCDPAQIAERLHAALGKSFRVERQDLVVSASIGIALGSTRYEEPDEILRDADIAMYTAKCREKGSHAIFDVAMHARAVSRMQIEAELRRAIEHDELEVHYQPIVDLQTGRTSAFEALIRWQHPDRGLLAPDQFLPIAEESGLMIRIGRWVLDQACQQLDMWRATGAAAENLRVSVNVSNGQFWHGGLLDDVDECLRAARLRPENVALEITEGVIMHNVDLACKLLEDLHGRGIELHIDDFGTGYSSLEALHHLPIDALKIDKSFIQRLGADPKSAELVRTIVLMGTNLGMELIAEGIETRAHKDHLRRLGTTYGQGFWFSRPVPSSVAGTLLDAPLPTSKPDPSTP